MVEGVVIVIIGDVVVFGCDDFGWWNGIGGISYV